MFVETENVITYSIYAPPELVAGMSSVDSYAFLDEWVVEALRSLGIDAWYEPINDITSSEGEIGGAAQARRPGAVLHHFTMSYEMNAAKMLDVLRIEQEKVSDKAIQSVEKRVGPLRRQTQLPREEIISRMISTFAERNTKSGLIEDRISPEELAEAEELARHQVRHSGVDLHPTLIRRGVSHLRRPRRRARAVPTAPAARAIVAPAATFIGSGSGTGGGSSLTPSSSARGGRPTYRPVLGGVKRAA